MPGTLGMAPSAPVGHGPAPSVGPGARAQLLAMPQHW